MLRKARLSCRLWPVMITGGQLESEDKGHYLVPKRDLIVGLQVLLQQRGLRIAGGMEYGETLLKEMTDMQVRISPGRHEQFGAWREGEHDDLVLAVAMACWGVTKLYPNELTGEDAYWKRVGRQPSLKEALGDNWRP